MNGCCKVKRKTMGMVILFLIVISTTNVLCYGGYDSSIPSSQEACGRRYKSSRMLKPPCDLSVESFCTKAGTTYPWNAVRHFVRENQGLMKRMYGDQLQRSVIEAELLSNDILESYQDDNNNNNEDLYFNRDFKSRYSKSLDLDNELLQDSLKSMMHGEEAKKNDDVMNTKFVFPEMSVKYGDLMNKTNNNNNNKTATTTMSTTENLNLKRTTDEETTKISITDSYNATYYFYEVEDVQNNTENSTERTTSTITTETESTITFEETTTEQPEKRKASTSTMLFQDTNQKKINSFKGQGINACPVKQEVVAPYWANNTRGEVLALINIYPFEQYIHCEMCTFQHKQMYCREGCRCEQQYRIHRLLAYDPNNECRGVFADWFKFPSCCICKCYFFNEGRVTARSPRSRDTEKYVPNWFKKKSKEYFNN
ncbi:protein spaetzle 4 [Onthophagus taurus]|uniref:protein spaetzle 4 n=1 Tax=Onthophagus taurus TaxID=166361 RepID=UPI0039BE22A9